MKPLAYFFALTVLIFGPFVTPSRDVLAQIPSSSAREVPNEVRKADPRVDQIIERANDHFRRGKLSLEDNKREQARDEFDKAIDEILVSGVDVRANLRLLTFYVELVERIYREEVPLISGRRVQNDVPKIGFREQSTSGPQAMPSDLIGSTIKSQGSSTLSIPKKFRAGYIGDDPVQAYSVLDSRKSELVKSTFETTQAFRERLKKVVSAIKIDGRTADAPFTFVTSGFDESYDADTETITMELNMSPWPILDLPEELVESFYRGLGRQTSRSDKYFWSFDLGRKNSLTVGSGVGKNAQGITARYVIRNYTTLHLAMRNASTNFDFPSGQKLTLKANPQKARSLVANIRIAVEGNLRFPFILKTPAGFSRATITHREERHFFELYLFVEPISLSVFDRRTGEILGTLELPVTERKGVLEVSSRR